MNIKLTKKRAKILSTIRDSQGVLTVKQLHQKIPEIDLVTIYRNLNLFVEQKLIKQIHLNKTGEALFEYQQQPHHHAQCSKCKKVIHFQSPDKQIIELLNKQGFKVEDIDITVKGTCCAR